MSSSKPKTTYYYKLFRVKRSDGRVTTVSVDPILVTRACQLLGFRTVSQFVRATALKYEDGMFKNCSGFVSDQLRQEVQRAASARAAAKAAATSAAVTTA